MHAGAHAPLQKGTVNTVSSACGQSSFATPPSTPLAASAGGPQSLLATTEVAASVCGRLTTTSQCSPPPLPTTDSAGGACRSSPAYSHHTPAVAALPLTCPLSHWGYASFMSSAIHAILMVRHTYHDPVSFTEVCHCRDHWLPVV